MKKIVLVIIAFALSIGLLSCHTTGSFPEDTIQSESDSISVSTIPEHQTVTIYVPKNLNMTVTIEKLAAEFMAENEDVTIEIEAFDLNAQDYAHKLSSDLLSGTGPDLLLIGFENVTSNAMSLLQTDAFADLQALNQVYGHMDWSDYESVADAFVWNGKRVAIPLFFTVPLMIGIEETLEEASIAYGKDASFGAFMESLAAYDGIAFRSPIMVAGMYRQVGLNVINQRSDSVDFNGDFKAFMEAYNELYPTISSGGYSSYLPSGQYENPEIGALLAGDILFYNRAAAMDINNIGYLYDQIRKAEKTPVIYAIPSLDGSSDVSVTPGICGGINASSESQEAALRFLAYLTSFEAGYDMTSYGISINRLYNDACRAFISGEEVILPEGIDEREAWHSLTYTLDAQFIEAYYAYMDAAVVKTLVDQDALNFVSSIMVDVQKNGMSMQEAIAKEESALKIYICE